MLRTTVKTNRVTHLSDARYCAGMGVDMLGFVIDPNNEHYVEVTKMREMSAWVAGVKIVAETYQNTTEGLLEILKTYDPDLVQTNQAAWLPWLKSELDKPLILSIEANQDADNIVDLMQQNVGFVEYFLLESPHPLAFDGDWPGFVQLLARQYPILLGFGIETVDLTTLLATTSVAGIALNGTTEIRPGYSEFGNLMDVLEALEED